MSSGSPSALERKYWGFVRPMPASLLVMLAKQAEDRGMQGLFAPQVYGPPFLPLATAAAVAFAGVIGFIGLIVPHLARILWGHNYKRLVPLSILGGSTALLLADLLARVVMAPQILPVGIVTALAGAPFFLWVLWRARNQAIW